MDQRALASAESLARRQAGLISHAQIRHEGLTTAHLRTLARTGRWVRLTRGVYRTPVPTLLDPWDEKRHRAAWLGLLAVPGSITVGCAALALHRIQGLPARVIPEVCLPRGRTVTGPVGVLVRRYRAPIPSITVNGFRVATVPAALLQALPQLPRFDGVAVVDSALHQRLLTGAELDTLEHQLRGRRGAMRAREVLALAHGEAESPLESRARVLFADAGLPPPQVQVRIREPDGL